jgi:hypothetical protein
VNPEDVARVREILRHWVVYGPWLTETGECIGWRPYPIPVDDMSDDEIEAAARAIAEGGKEDARPAALDRR